LETQKLKVLFYPMLPAFQESRAVYNVFRFRQFVFLLSTNYMIKSTKRRWKRIQLNCTDLARTAL